MSETGLIQRVVDNPEFARDLAEKAQAAVVVPPTSANVQGPEWSALLDAVAESPEDRAKMVAALEARPADSPEKLSRMLSALQEQSAIAEFDLPPTTTTTTITTSGCLTMATTFDCAKFTLEITKVTEVLV